MLERRRTQVLMLTGAAKMPRLTVWPSCAKVQFPAAMRSEIRGELLVHADWWQLVAPGSTEWLHDRTLDRRVVIRREVNVTDTRQWWTAIQCSNVTDASISALGCWVPSTGS